MRYLIVFGLLVAFLTGCSSLSEPVPGSVAAAPQVQQQRHPRDPGWTWFTWGSKIKRDQSLLTIASDGRESIWIGRVFSVPQLVHVSMGQKATPYNLDFWPQAVVLASDGNLWMTGYYSGFIAKMAPTGGPVTKYPITPGRETDSMIVGLDDALWYTDCEGSFGNSVVGRIALDGTDTTFPVAGCPKSIANGPDGNFWITNANGSPPYREIDSMTTLGMLTRFQTADLPENIIAGPDGNLWFTSSTGLNRITTAGAITTYPLAGADNVAVGSDGNLWVTDGTAVVPFSLSSDTFGTAVSPTIALPYGMHRMVDGPDGNLWFVSGTLALTMLLHDLSVAPKSVSIPAPGDKATLTVSETNYSGLFSGSSSNRAVATIARGNKAGTLVVTAVGVGSCVVTVNDMDHNTMQIPVTVN